MELVKQEPGERIAVDICEAIRSGRLLPGDKLQGEAELVRLYNGSVYHVRKAIARLKARNVLYSVPKVGIFVAGEQDAKPVAAVESPVSGPCLLTAEDAELRDCWEAVRQGFAERMPFAPVRVAFGEPDSENPPDLWACSSPLHKYQFEVLDSFDFSDSPEGAPELLTPTVLHFLDAPDLLLYHPEMLERAGLPLPEYTSWGGQLEYLERIISACRSNGWRIPGTVQQPLLRLNHRFYELFAELRTLDRDAFVEKYRGMAEEVTKLWQRYRISPPKQAAAGMRDFFDRRTPIFFGSDIEFRGAHREGVACEALPMLDLDSRPQTHANCLLLSRRTEYPVECIRFLRYLQGHAAQRCFAAAGKVPLDAADFDAMPYGKAIEHFRQPEGGRSKGFFFHSRAEQYIGMNIVNIELWEVILFDKAPEAALKDLFDMAQLYLRFNLDRTVGERREQQAELYS